MQIDGIIGIDPGNIYTGFAVIDGNFKPLEFGKVENKELIGWFEMNRNWLPKTVYIEKVASYGMSVGQTVFDTCEWIGRYTQFFEERGFKVKFVRRKEYVTEFCGSSRAKDANVTQYLIDRFAPNTPNHGKGSKKEPGFFYGFKADIWQAYAVSVWGEENERRSSITINKR